MAGPDRITALNAVALSRGLAADLPLHGLQCEVLRSGNGAWEVATGADTPMPGAEGNAMRTGLAGKLTDWYVNRVRERAPTDPVVCTAFRDVLFLQAPPSSLLTSPQVLRRALFHPVAQSADDVSTVVVRTDREVRSS